MGKLEGPKKHHNNHGPNASVPGKGDGMAVPGKHWEKRYSLSEPSENMYLTQGDDFCPKVSDERKTTHLKVNREDH